MNTGYADIWRGNHDDWADEWTSIGSNYAAIARRRPSCDAADREDVPFFTASSQPRTIV